MPEAAPLVSVVTIFRNAPVGFFEEAIASVLAQTEPGWELLLVDDGSTDESPDVARRAVAADPERMRVLTHPRRRNRGMSASRNLGIAAARGEFVAFLDADDVYLPEKLERQLAVLAGPSRGGHRVRTDAALVELDGRPGRRRARQRRRLGVEPRRVVRPPELVRAYLERRADTPATCGVLVRRAAIEAVGGFEPRFLDLYEDQAFFFKLLLVEAAYVEGQAWDRYRRHPDAMCEVRIREGEHADDYSLTGRAARSWNGSRATSRRPASTTRALAAAAPRTLAVPPSPPVPLRPTDAGPRPSVPASVRPARRAACRRSAN